MQKEKKVHGTRVFTSALKPRQTPAPTPEAELDPGMLKLRRLQEMARPKRQVPGAFGKKKKPGNTPT